MAVQPATLVSFSSILRFGAVDDTKAIPVSISMSESHEFTADVTEHPLESGADVADHRVVKPTIVNVDGAIVDDDALGHSPLLGVPDSGAIARARADAYKKMIDMFNAKETFTLVTALKAYEKMVFSRLSISRDKSTGHGLYFKATLRQIEFATSETKFIAKPPDVARIHNKKDLGPVTTTKAPDKTAEEATEKAKSAALRIKNKAKDVLNSLAGP